MYLTYSEYMSLSDGEIEPFAFQRLEYKARRYIDSVTHGRLHGECPVRESVKRCMAELVGMMAMGEAEEAQAASMSGVRSVSNDGVSITYAGARQAVSDRAERMKNVVFSYLTGEQTREGVNLLYAGVNV